MSINFQAVTGQNKDRDVILSGMEADGRIVSSPSKAAAQEKSSVLTTLDSSFFTNDAYAKPQRNAEDIAAMARDTDVGTMHNYMALLSNTLSEEDYKKAAEDGFDLKSINSKETVTIVDKIKGALLSAGVEVAGFNDDLSLEKLEKITGSATLARAISNNFHEKDIPLTSDNVKAVKTAYEQISDLEGLSDSAVKYMVQNNMKPTMGNIYFASHSTNGQDAAGRGFYAQDTAGYYAQKADSFNWDQLAPQMEKVIEEAGLDPKDAGAYDNAKWMVEQGIPLTAENLVSATDIRSISFPISPEAASEAASSAIADGKRAIDGNLFDPKTNYEKAAEILDKTKEISDEDVKNTVISGRDLTIRNLTGFHAETFEQVAENDERLVRARLQLEEVRLVMTVQSNKQLLDSGFSIDTAPMEDLIERLKAILGQTGERQMGRVVDASTKVTPQTSGAVFSMTMSSISFISRGPADISGAVDFESKSATLYEISSVSRSLTMKFQAANQGYETMMTAPRADLGDSIRKAFGNVDNILQDMGEETSDENRRVVRILGYNSLEINENNFERVRSWDQKLRTTLERLKPGAVLELIRQGKNPLGMTIEELGRNLDQNESGNKGREKSEEKYSRFLYKLEKKGGITESEKASFIGIYRLFHNLKKTDYRAIGSLLKTGQEMTLENLLTADRTFRTGKRGMDYTVDESFNGVEAGETQTLRIDEQISAAFRFYSSEADKAYENLEPEKLMATPYNGKTLLPDFADRLAEAESDEELEREYVREQVNRIRQTASLKAAEPALEEMSASELEVTFNNLEAMIAARRDRRDGKIWYDAEKMIGKEADELEDDLVDLMEDEDYHESYVKVLEKISDKLSEELMNASDTYVDVRAISLMNRQLSVMTALSDHQSYEVPVDVRGEKVSMHITLKRDESGRSRMDAGVQTIEYGLLSVSLYIREGEIQGMLGTTNSRSAQESEYLEDVRQRLCERLEEKIMDAGVSLENIAILYHAQASPQAAGAFYNNATEGEETKLETQTLLKMAKAFIEAL